MSLEPQRAALEELQTIERALADRIARNPELSPQFLEDEHPVLPTRKKRSFREMLLQQHEMSRFVETYKTLSASISAPDVSELEDKTFELVKFDELFRKIKERQEGTEMTVKSLQEVYAIKSSGVSVLSQVCEDVDLGRMFSGEEYFGKYIDLIGLHERWLNLSSVKLGYVKYLELFDKFDMQDVVKDGRYVEYLQELSSYLQSFIRRAKPLFELDALVEQLQKEYYESNEAAADPLYCKACNKTFAKQTVFDAHLTGKKHLKNAAKDTSTQRTDFKFLEFQIPRLVQVVEKERQETKLNTERRRALTERERLIELDQLEREENLSSSDEEEDKEEENKDMNPMGMLLGPEGQPIPHWLYKLHGLDITYPCEICSNQTYQGRKAFDRHFLEAKHIHGLKCLGITQPEKFKSITKIEEAKKLWESIRGEERRRAAERENAVEVEDEDGNVMSEKVYEDLKKQGLV